MNVFLLFVSSFGVVFALGFQSLNVNAGHYRAAFFTSLVIGTFNLFLFKLTPNVSSPAEVAAFLLGGPFGIVSSMWVHARLKAWREQREILRSQQALSRAYEESRSFGVNDGPR